MNKSITKLFLLLNVVAGVDARFTRANHFALDRVVSSSTEFNRASLTSVGVAGRRSEARTWTRTLQHGWVQEPADEEKQPWVSRAAARLDRSSGMREEGVNPRRHGHSLTFKYQTREKNIEHFKRKARELQGSTSFESCLMEAKILEADENSSYKCACQENASGTAYGLQCVETCGAFCNTAGTICGKRIKSKDFDSTGLATVSEESFQYTHGKVGKVTVSERECSEDGTCSACIVVVDGISACNSCSMQTCSGGGAAPLANCENIEGGSIFDFCANDFGEASGEFDFLSGNGYIECIDPLAQAKESCNTDIGFFESSYPDKQYACKCKENSLGRVVLECDARCGEFCNADDSVCGTEAYEQFYDISGNPMLIADNFLYTRGRTGRVDVVQTECEGTTPGEITCSSCYAQISPNERCQSCIMQTCDSDNGVFYAPLLNCQNLDNGAIYNLCEPESIGAGGGVFEVFSSDEFNICSDNSPTNDVCSEAQTLQTTQDTELVGNTEFAIDDGTESCVKDSSAGSRTGPGLWYMLVGEGKGIVASTCGEETQIDTQISIYTGPCDELTCEAANDDSSFGECVTGQSAVSWFGEEGVVYHIRVRGFGFERGQFKLSIVNTDLAEEACQSVKAFSEATSDVSTGTSCECLPMDDGSQSLACRSSCEYCNNEQDVCSSSTFGGIFDSTKTLHTWYEEHTYKIGRSEVIKIEETGCVNSGECQTCSATIDGEECNSCELIDCPEGSGKRVDCSNVETGAVFNECNDPVVIETGVLETLSSEEFSQCLQEPLQACQNIAASTENMSSDVGATCTCEDDGQGAAVLSCRDTSCQYCSTDTSVCADKVYGGVITGNDGELTTWFEEYQYTEGRTEIIRHEKTDGQCTLTVDGTKCNSCEIVECEGALGLGYEGSKFDCENIASGAILNECDGLANIEEGIFQVFSQLEFDECLGADSPEDVCMERKGIEESKGETEGLGTVCECTNNAVEGTYTLICKDTECLFCNWDASVCAENMYGYQYGRFGNVLSQIDGYKYVSGGRDEEVILEKTDGDCEVRVDGESCSSCEAVTCAAGTLSYKDIKVECGNLQEGVSFDGCEQVFVDTGVLEVATDFEFGKCVKQRTSLEACEEEIEKVNNDNDCECTENEYEGHTMTCLKKGCLYCNGEGSVCGYDIVGKRFGILGQDLGLFNGFQYIEGRSDYVLYEPVTDPSDDRTCKVSVGGEECASCDIVGCGGGIRGLEVQCDNVEGAGNFNECELSPVLSGPMEYFSVSEFKECVEVQDPIQLCEQQKDYAELSQVDSGTVCDCVPTDDAVRFTCSDMNCMYCNEDESICGLAVSYGGDIGKYGSFVSSFEIRQYIVGRDNRVMVQETPPHLCRVSIDGEECQSCQKVVCDDNSVELEINCENIIPDAVFSGCTGENNDAESVLASFYDGLLGTCVEYEGTFPPLPTTADLDLDQPSREDDTKGSSGNSLYSISGISFFGLLPIIMIFMV